MQRQKHKRRQQVPVDLASRPLIPRVSHTSGVLGLQGFVAQARQGCNAPCQVNLGDAELT